MKIAFVFMGAESLGVAYLSAVARAAGHETRLFFDPAAFGGKVMLDSPALSRLLDRRARIVRAMAAYEPDVAAFSCFTGNYRWSLDVARAFRAARPGAPVVFGGVHVSAVPERVIAEDCVDAALAGEGESVFIDLLQSVTTGGGAVPGALIKFQRSEGIPWGHENSLGTRSGIKVQIPVMSPEFSPRNSEILSAPPLPPLRDLDTLPHPDKSLFYSQVPALEQHYMIMAARGCPFACTYCYKSLDGPAGAAGVRQRGVDSVLDELRPFKKRGVTHMVVFRDDVFGTNRKWLEEFTEKYPREIGLPYFCYTHPGAVDAERAALLRRGGCVFTTMGIQSADDATRRELLNRKYTNEQAAASVRALKEQGIAVSLDHITGLPGDTTAAQIDAARFYAELQPDRLLTFWLECFPGTRILEIVKEKGIISGEQHARILDGHAGYRYAGGTLGAADKSFNRAVNLLNLIPLLPRGLTQKILNSKLLQKLIPAWPGLQHILMAANAVKSRDPFFFYNLKFMFSKKKLSKQ